MKTSNTGILIIHGFAGSRGETAPLKNFLEDCGFTVSCPVLPGHESTRKNFAKAKYGDWISAAAEAAIELEKNCDRLIIIGFSMGGMIGAHLCRNMNVERLILINTPVYYWDFKQMAKNLRCDFGVYSRKYLAECTNKPFMALIQFQKLLSKTKPLFSKLACPVLIIQTLDDDTVNSKSADYIFRNIPGEKYIKKYEVGGHWVLDTDTSKDIFFETERFSKAL